MHGSQRCYYRMTLITCVALIGLSLAQGANAQTTSTTGQQQIDINQLLQSLGGLGNLGSLTGGTGFGQTTTGGTTTGTTTGTTGTGTTGNSTTAPSTVTNQFTTTSSGALQQRRPGLFVQQAIALQNGTLTLPGTGEPVEPNFFRDTAQQITLTIVDSINNLLNTINTGLGLAGGLPGLPGSGGNPTIPNPATSGAGTTTTIE